MTLDELKTRVKIKLDEYTPSGVSHSFDDYLGPMIQESADELSDKAPIHLLDPEDIDIGDIEHEDDLAFIPAPSDYARLYDIKFAHWKRPVHKAITPEDSEHERQENEYLTAGYGRPVVMIKSCHPSGGALGKHIVCGKVVSSNEPTYARYVAYKDAADMPNVLDEALTWLAASKIFQQLGESEQSKVTYANHLTELQNKIA